MIGRPLIGVTACRLEKDSALFDGVRVRAVEAVTQAVQGLPLLIPTFGAELDLESLLSRLDGLLLTGSESNIEPHHYGAEPIAPGGRYDPHRDATVLPLIRLAVASGIPIFALCRGFQEINVAFGGSLHQHVHEVPGLEDHREDLSQPRDIQYEPAHDLTLTGSGMLARLLGRRSVRVNSLHGQGIKTLGRGLVVEARAPDGLIEAFRVEAGGSFALGVQWHPEWFATDDPVSLTLFRAFADACRARARRARPHPEQGEAESDFDDGFVGGSRLAQEVKTTHTPRVRY